eukprot:TRINITY_DN109754_c0_g1_i1.p1 TRINITY_DN109754_c0_g1~~TRINITY_DN109754_c0_g1_i1.p1  ORF type:complete len:258 (-),score=54.13 TRINITY_DN109754_c0_g1_i1:42-761(-)
MAAAPNSELFVTGLPIDAKSETAQPIFAQFGNVKEVTVLPVKAGKTAAAAFVSMASIEDATQVVNALNGQVMPGTTTPLEVVYATPKGQRYVDQNNPFAWMMGPYGGKGASDEPPPENETLYIKSLPGDSTKESVTALFSQYGSVVSCNVLPPKGDKNMCAGFVKMATVAEAKWIVENVNNNVPNGLATPIEVIFATPNYGGGGKAMGKMKGKMGMMMGMMAMMGGMKGYGPMKGKGKW